MTARERTPLLSGRAARFGCQAQVGSLDTAADRDAHLALWGTVQIVEEDGTPPVHPVDAIPDTDASAGLLVTFILKQQAWVQTETDKLLNTWV